MFLSHCVAEKLWVIIQFIFCHQTLFSGLIQQGCGISPIIVWYGTGFGHWDVRLAAFFGPPNWRMCGSRSVWLARKAHKMQPRRIHLGWNSRLTSFDSGPDRSMRLMCIWTAPLRCVATNGVVLKDDELSRTGGGQCFVVPEPSLRLMGP